MAAHLPPPFRPQLVNGYAIGGICLIRLGQVRPRWFPLPIGLRSENAAHRIAVEWDAPPGSDGAHSKSDQRQGVYIPRRDTDSRLSSLAGGRIFPGEHHLATFDVSEDERVVSCLDQQRSSDNRRGKRKHRSTNR